MNRKEGEESGKHNRHVKYSDRGPLGKDISVWERRSTRSETKSDRLEANTAGAAAGVRIRQSAARQTSYHRNETFGRERKAPNRRRCKQAIGEGREGCRTVVAGPDVGVASRETPFL
ncbi:hypothetical protein L596_016352 [Steinernema carpocapsae]|uniref:Uncharacterized protein n=1 Tax=Steinernema carpocapsae TaxID=34508 RepID=A0A4U5NIS9_STECR|nr:hypothetical protein L596_016352 [Steinernema carpocapsae]